MDHLVFAAPDLDEGVRHIETHLGIATSPGGRHAGYGTKNRLVGLGPKTVSYTHLTLPTIYSV